MFDILILKPLSAYFVVIPMGPHRLHFRGGGNKKCLSCLAPPPQWAASMVIPILFNNQTYYLL